MSRSRIFLPTRFWFLMALLAFTLTAVATCGDDETPQADVGDDTGPDAVVDPVDEEIPLWEEEPGTIEMAGRPEMDLVTVAHEAANPSDEEVVIYYYRSDGDYEPWGVWLWAMPGGNGADHWDYTQDFVVVEGVGYLKFRKDGADVGGVSPISAENLFGFIIRKDADWTKDGDQDRSWNVETSNEVVVFSGDQGNYPYGPYIPSFEEAVMTTPTTIKVRLSGRHALEVVPDDNGFVVRHADDSRTYEIADIQNFDSPEDRNANYTDLLLVTLAEGVEIGPALVIEHPQYLEPFSISTIDLFVQAAESTLPASDYRLGALYTDGSDNVEFRVWSPLSSEVVARIYSASGATEPAYSVPLTLDEATGVWSGTFDTVDPGGMFYDYLVTNRNGTNACLDPYTRSMDAYQDTGGAGRGAIVDLESASATPEGWAEDAYYDLTAREEAIIYEIHVRDFTIAPDSGVTGQPGTYLAFIEKLDYLADLGVTHIQLLPVLNFYYTDETDRAYEDSGTASGNNYNWGYDPHNYFTPEGWYASDPTDPYARVKELRELIMAIHEAGMAVTLDVVYNHMAGTFLLDYIVPHYYFRTNPDGSLTSNSGCGNDVATTRTMARRLIVDSTRFWVEHYHVDGFRFDLMGLIDTETMEAAHAACAEVNEQVLFVGEGWKMYNGPEGTRGTDQNYMIHTDDITVFNDEIRDLLKAGGLNDQARGFLTNHSSDTQDIFRNLIGQPQDYYTADDPGDSLTYGEAHDNLTMHDNIAHNMPLNDINPAQRQEIIDRMQIGNFLILTGQAIPFLHGGQERARSKPRRNSTTEIIGNFVSNSYDAADNINQFPWTLDDPAQELYAFTRGLIQIRRATPAFRIGDQEAIDTAAAHIPHTSGLALGYSVTWEGDTYFILANAGRSAATFDLGTDLASAAVLVDSDEAVLEGVSEASGFTLDGSQVTLDPLVPLLLRLAQ
ncbi:MAG: hypothetical protein JW797_05555 [Bradymonadales bacterium]|nr:hypothetical protein [Bradymonadales bacterium]